jgi:hypothetical protein
VLVLALLSVSSSPLSTLLFVLSFCSTSGASGAGAGAGVGAGSGAGAGAGDGAGTEGDVCFGVSLALLAELLFRWAALKSIPDDLRGGILSADSLFSLALDAGASTGSAGADGFEEAGTFTPHASSSINHLLMSLSDDLKLRTSEPFFKVKPSFPSVSTTTVSSTSKPAIDFLLSFFVKTWNW